jgi:hypothetical protein
MDSKKEHTVKQDYTVRIFKLDGRCARGERLVSTTVWADRTEAGIKRECRELEAMWPKSKGYRVIYYATMKTVKNLMTGKDVQIDADTPWCCNPASETYWSM